MLNYPGPDGLEKILAILAKDATQKETVLLLRTLTQFLSTNKAADRSPQNVNAKCS